MKGPLARFYQFIRHGVWTIDADKLSRLNRYLVKLLRIIILAVEDYTEKKLMLQASALTFYSILSLVPVVAMVFGIAKGFGLEDRLRDSLFNQFSQQPELLHQILDFVNRLLANTEGGLMALLGFLILIWSVVQVLSNIEMSFNSIWQVSTPRTWVRKFTDYLSIMLLSPIFIVGSGSFTIFISAFITEFAKDWISLGPLRDILIFSINFTPYFLSSLLFTLLYMVMPNTRVEFKSAAVAGIIAGISFQIFQWGYIEFQVGVSRINAIYGSFAFLPLFIIFLQMAWIIVLIGAEVSYSLQNIEMHVDERIQFKPSQKDRLVMALAIMSYAGQRFMKGEPAPSGQEIANFTGLPYRPVKEFCRELCGCGLLSRVMRNHRDGSAYQPAVALSKLNISYIIEKLDSIGEHREVLSQADTLKPFQQLVQSLYHENQESSYNYNIDQLIEMHLREAKPELDANENTEIL